MKRDLHADLALCEAAASGFIFHTGTYSGSHGLYTETTVTTDSYDNISETDMEFLLEARQGWSEAIRRAIAAEERVKELCESNAYYIDQAGRHENDVYWTTRENERLRSALELMDDRKRPTLPRSVMARIARETLDKGMKKESD